MLNNKLFYILKIGLISVLLVSCADDPNSVGNNLIPDGDKIFNNSIELYPDSVGNSFSSFQKDIGFFGSSSKILLGKYANITSEILISFSISLPDSIEEHIKNETGYLKSSWFAMQPNYWIGDSVGYKFSAQQINTSWTSINIDQDTIDNIRSSIGPNILESFTYTSGDTSIRFSIEKDVVNNWISALIDESLPSNYGLLLSPTESTNGVAGFQALTSFPSDIFPQFYLEFDSNDGTLDTVIANPKLDMHIVNGERLPEPVNEVLLQGSLGVRGKLKFDLSSVPSNIIVNSAIIDLYVNENNSFEGSVGTDTLALSFYYDSENDSLITSFGKYPLVNKNGMYSGEVRQFIQRWLQDEPNEGVEVKLSDENRSISAISFYGSNYSTKSLRPRLKIYYTTK